MTDKSSDEQKIFGRQKGTNFRLKRGRLSFNRVSSHNIGLIQISSSDLDQSHRVAINKNMALKKQQSSVSVKIRQRDNALWHFDLHFIWKQFKNLSMKTARAETRTLVVRAYTSGVATRKQLVEIFG